MFGLDPGRDLVKRAPWAAQVVDVRIWGSAGQNRDGADRTRPAHNLCNVTLSDPTDPACSQS